MTGENQDQGDAPATFIQQLKEQLQSKDREILDLQEGHAFVEKSLQDEIMAHSKDTARMELIETRWEEEKRSLADYREKYCNMKADHDAATKRIRDTEFQLAQSRKLTYMSTTSEVRDSSGKDTKSLSGDKIEAEGENTQMEPARDCVSKKSTAQEDKSKNKEQTKNHQADKDHQEACVFEIIKKGSCGRNVCRFSHEITQENSVNSGKKIEEMSAKLNKCLYEVVEKGLCITQKEKCNHPHNFKQEKGPRINRKMAEPTKLCYKEMVRPGSCPRGNTCWFSHDIPAEIQTSPEHIKKVENHPSVLNLCVNEYRKERTCKKGFDCNFRHNITKEERENPDIQMAMKAKWEKVTNQVTPNESNGMGEGATTMKELLSFIKEIHVFMKQTQLTKNCP